MLELRCEFPDTHKFHAKYQRNNKRTGLKNLRCYPFCGPDDTHHENGFCGASVRALVSVHSGSSYCDASKLLAWGELISKSERPPRFPLGTVFTKSEVKRILRTDTNHLNPLFEAANTVTGHNERQFSFESQKKGWHYEWRGNKYTSDKPHAFVVYVAVPMSSDTYHCIGVFYSPVFTMFCRRRHKTVPEAEKNQMALAVPPEERVCKLALLPNGKCVIFDRPPALSTPPGSLAKNVGEDDETSDGEGSTMLSEDEKPAKTAVTSKRKSNAADRPSNGGSGSKRPRTASQARPSGKKARPDKDGTGHKLMRVLMACGNVDKLKRRLQHDLARSSKNALGTPLTSMSSNTTDDELDMAWLDALAGSLQDNFLDEDFAMPFKGGSVNDIFDIVEQPLAEEPNQERVRAVEVVESLGRFLVEEDSVTKAIQDIAAHGGTYGEFLQMVHKHINNFLRDRYKMSVDALDAALRGETYTENGEISNGNGMQDAFNMLVYAASIRGDNDLAERPNQSVMVPPKSHSLASSPRNGPSLPAQSVPPSSPTLTKVISDLSHVFRKSIQLPPGIKIEDFIRPPKPLRDDENPDIAGMWLRPESNAAEMEKWRKVREMEWVQRQLIGKMERRFEFEQQKRGEVIVRLSPKLFSNGMAIYTLDGVERPFSLLNPLGPGANLAVSACAWAIGPCVCIRNSYSATERLTRCIWKVGEDELHGVHIYQARGGAWEEEGKGSEGFPVSEDGWKVVHVTKQVCAREKPFMYSARANASSSEAEDA